MNLYASRTSSGVRLDWTNTSTDSTLTIEIQYTKDSANSYQLFGYRAITSKSLDILGSYPTSSWYRFRIRYIRSSTSEKGSFVYSDYLYKVPAAPTNASASRQSDSTASVTWTRAASPDYAPISDQYVERQTDGGSWVQLARVAPSLGEYVDSTISANHRYRYRVRSGNDAGKSAYATSGYIYTTPAAPTAVNVNRASAGVISVGVTASAPYATGFDVQRRENGGSWTSVATNTSMPINDSTTAETVRYRVRSVRGSLASAWKESADVQAVVAPNAPTITAKPAAVLSVGQTATVAWTPNHPDGSAQSQAQVLLTAPDETSTTVDISGTTAQYTFTPDSVGVWTAQVRTHGLAASWGAWSQTIQWRMADRPSVAITSPATDGTEIDDLPLVISWEVTDVSGVSSQKVTIAQDGDAVYTRTPATSARSLQVTRYDAAFEDGEAYTISIRVVNGYGLDTTAVRTFAIGWDLPSVPDITVDEGEGASASITVGTGPGSTVPTESITVQRVAPDGSTWTVAAGLQDGDTVSDPLAPLGVDVTYRAIAYASSGASSASEAVANIRSSGWVLGFGDAAGEWLVLVGNPDASYSLEQGGELFHFADGGAGGGLPVWYGTTDRDEGGSLSFGTVGQHDSDRLRELARKWPVGWLRDPFGHRWRARILPSVKHGLGELWTVGIDWTAVRWREAWDG